MSPSFCVNMLKETYELVINLSVCLQVRSISLNVRKNVSLNTLSQDVLLKEFSTISWDTHTHTHPASSSLQTDIHTTFSCVWTCTHTFTHNVQISNRYNPPLFFLVLWADPRKLLPQTHWQAGSTLRKRLKTLQTCSLCGCSYVCDNFKEVPVLHWFLVCNLQYWLDC